MGASCGRRPSRSATSCEPAGRTPYSLPAGSSSPLGAVGFVAAWFELRDQLARPRVDAGDAVPRLLLGRHARRPAARPRDGRGQGRRCARSAWPPTSPRHARAYIAASANGAAELLGLEPSLTDDDVGIDMGFLGDGYGSRPPEGVEAIRLLAATEGIVCDPIYSGKALAALVAAARAGELGGPRSSGTRAATTRCSRRGSAGCCAGLGARASAVRLPLPA